MAAKYEARCMKCKENVEVSEPKAVQMERNGVKTNWAVRGKHAACGTNMYKIIGKNKPADL